MTDAKIIDWTETIKSSRDEGHSGGGGYTSTRPHVYKDSLLCHQTETISDRLFLHS